METTTLLINPAIFDHRKLQLLEEAFTKAGIEYHNGNITYDPITEGGIVKSIMDRIILDEQNNDKDCDNVNINPSNSENNEDTNS